MRISDWSSDVCSSDLSINGRLVQWLHAASVDFSASSREEAASLQSGRSALGQGLQTEPIERSSAPTFIARPGSNSAIPRSAVSDPRAVCCDRDLAITYQFSSTLTLQPSMRRCGADVTKTA